MSETLHTTYLPPGWALAKVKDLALDVQPGFPFGGYTTDGRGVPHLRPMNIDRWGRLSLEEVKYVDAGQRIPLLATGDILFNNTNSPVWGGKTTVISEGGRFVLQLHYMQQGGFFQARCNNHVNQASISSSYLAEKVQRLAPPLDEQRRIVAAIEERFTRLDAGVAALRRAQGNLKRYRAAVLKAAVEGELTAAWRAAHPDAEPAVALLTRILAERRARWEADLRAKGKDPARARYVEPAPLRDDGLPALPEGWCWATLGECFHVAVGATPSRKEPAYWEGTIPWVSSGEVQFCRILETRETITAAGMRNSSTQLNHRGSVLLGMIGEGRTRGQCAILDVAACNNQNCAALWVSETEVPPEFVFYWLWSRYDITRAGSSGNNQPALNKARVEEIPIPLPPLAEQERIVAEVERRLSVTSEVEALVDASMRRAERLRQSVLREAFAGRLGMPS